jgi:hypothetical protein
VVFKFWKITLVPKNIFFLTFFKFVQSFVKCKVSLADGTSLKDFGQHRRTGLFYGSPLGSIFFFPVATPPAAKKSKLVELDGAAADVCGGAATPSNDAPVVVLSEQLNANGDEPSVARPQVPSDDETTPTDANGAAGLGGETAANNSDTKADEGKLAEANDERGPELASC